MSTTPVPATLRQLPNALTIVRFAAVPAFAVAFLAAGDGAAWGAGFLFGGAAHADGTSSRSSAASPTRSPTA
jgi:phosphatidylglycerophosphate synthase